MCALSALLRSRSRSAYLTGMVTLTFLIICAMSVFFGKGIKREVLVLPVTNLFAFTQLRSTMPGAPPGFGKYSYLFMSIE